MPRKRRRSATSDGEDPRSDHLPDHSVLNTRTAHEPPEPSQKSKVGSHLTLANLAQLQADQPSETPSTFPPPFDVMSRPPPSSPSKTNTKSGSTTLTQAEKILQVHRIYIDEGTEFPPEVQTLAKTVKERRDTDVTPKSKYIAKVNTVTRKMLEDMAVHELADKILYRCRLFDGDGGEPGIWRGRSDQWWDRVPLLGTGDEEELQRVMEAVGCPKKPKPDLSYGYSDTTIGKELLFRLSSLPKEVLVCDRAPWFPYLVAEWKSAEPMKKAEQQARRDAAAAIDTLYKLFKLADPATEPSPALTCVFSLCVDANMMRHRLHWRHVESNGSVSYHAEYIKSALLEDEDQVFIARGTLLKALEWARGSRLTAILEALKKAQPPKASTRYIVLHLLFP
ncbi:MAG: hypothetical protein Q9225_006835 [Loekoesia sp. 1 TL-2023]